LKTDYQKLSLAAANTKKNDAISQWVQDAISLVYLEIDPEYQECAEEVIKPQ
jgi:peptidyl-prolyl cis-trans isomerase SurA